MARSERGSRRKGTLGVTGFDFVTGNDWQVMERGLCLGLGGGAAACGGPNAYGY